MRATYQFGFHRRASLLGVKGWGAQKESGLGWASDEPYDEARIHERSRIIALAIDARHQRFPHEPRYHYQPLADEPGYSPLERFHTRAPFEKLQPERHVDLSIAVGEARAKADLQPDGYGQLDLLLCSAVALQKGHENKK